MCEPKEVHIPLTLYGANPDGSESKEKLMAYMSRPQDWGHPRWRYEQVKFQLVTDAGGYDDIFVYHLWADLPLAQKAMIELFMHSFLRLRSKPGRPAELCGRTHLAEDEFWEKAWGVRPPTFEEESDDDWGEP